MKLDDFMYTLPKELIAQEPLKERPASRLLVLDRKTGTITHKNFSNLSEYLEGGDCLVLNDTRVIPARLFGKKKDTGGKIEFLLMEKKDGNIWEVMLKPGKLAKPGVVFQFGEGELEAEIIRINEDGSRIVNFKYKKESTLEQILDRLGTVPLPPYITKKLTDEGRYQTVYNKNPGSSAAPTAGLHFNREMLDRLRNEGVGIAFLTLHVGAGTFKPVKSQDITTHKMHAEYFNIERDACELINRTRKNGRRIISVGTTSLRVLETIAALQDIKNREDLVKPASGKTDIFIYPGFSFRLTDCLLTNFHLPGSTLLMLVSAMAGRDFIMSAYNEAIQQKYRFFSFGDAMLII